MTDVELMGGDERSSSVTILQDRGIWLQIAESTHANNVTIGSVFTDFCFGLGT